MVRRFLAWSSLIAATAVGCARNDRLSVGDLEGSLTYRLPAVAQTPAMQPAAAPSLRGVDRSHWRTTVVAVPVDEISNFPTLRLPEVRLADATARQRGDYPNAFSAVTPVSDQGDQAAEAGFDLAIAAFEVLSAPIMGPLALAGAAPIEQPVAYDRVAVGPISPVFDAPWFAGPAPAPPNQQDAAP